MSDPSPSPSHDDGSHAVLVGDGLGQECSLDSSKVLVVESGQFVVVAFNHPAYSRVESAQLWCSLSLVLELYWDDFHTLFSIRSESVPGLVEAIPEVAAHSVVKPDSATKVGEFFGCWKIFSVSFDRRGVWDIQHHHFFLLHADPQASLLCKHAETGVFLLHVLTSA